MTLTVNRCGKEFCYVCGQAWKTCDCPLWHEDRLVAVVNEAVDEEVAPDANVYQRRNAAARIREDLLHHEDIGCDHHRRSQWAWRDKGLRCEICNTYMRAYIFVCKNCRMRACYGCRRHRLR